MSSGTQKLTCEVHDYIKVRDKLTMAERASAVKASGASQRVAAPSVGEVAGQIFLERPAIAELDRVLRRKGLGGFRGELAQALLVGRIEIEKICLVHCGQDRKSVEERFSRGQLGHQP